MLVKDKRERNGESGFSLGRRQEESALEEVPGEQVAKRTERKSMSEVDNL